MTLDIRLERWSEPDRPLLERLNAPEMTEHLGGPEAPDALERRHRRYAENADSDSVYIFRIMGGADRIPVGSISFWERDWQGEAVYEIGWGVLPEHQGRGIGSRAVALAVDLAAGLGRRDAMHAFPGIDNLASNGICRKVGFTLLGECDFEYPKGRWMRCNDWRISLRKQDPLP